MNVIDLTAAIYDGMPVYPGDPKVSVEQIQSISENGWELRQLSMGSHTGTHVDAFSHMHQGGANLDEMPLTRFFGPATLVELSSVWPSDVGLLFNQAMNESYLDRLLLARPPFVGGDLSENLEKALLAHGIVTYTGLVNLDQLPVGVPFTFYGLPLKISNGDGSPVRAIALL